MKKIICLLALFSVLGACAAAEKVESPKAKLTACITQKAQEKFQAGALKTVNVKKTAKQISTACIKELALPAEEANAEEANKTATGILQTLLNSKKAK